MTDAALHADRPLPTGTVTFLFTDIEGSTKLWDTHQSAMRVALPRHDFLVREAIAKTNGHVFKTVGDGFCAAFSLPSEAVAAALMLQRTLHAEPWPDATPIKVRIALHTGMVESQDRDYFGPPVNRVARLLATGHGGQTLLSQSTYELAWNSVPDAAFLRDLGTHQLKDLARPERVYELQHPDLRCEFPLINSLSTHPNNLPQQLTSFIGREKEIAGIEALLSKARAITLIGSGGSGKTRLALQVAADTLAQYPDGAWFVELAALSDADLVPQALASVLGVKEEPGKSVAQTLAEHLRPKQLLLVIDNCEHLLDACAKLVVALLRLCPDVQTLATSRARFGITGEHTYRVPSLSLPDPKREVTPESLVPYESVQLFVDRALLVNPQFRVTGQNAPALASLCYHLDGIPLAIELAAARVRALSVEEIVGKLNQRFRLLIGGSRTALARQRTLRALVDWSYDMLDEAERALFCRSSVFASGWMLEAAEQACCGDGVDEGNVIDLLTSLADKSLVLVEERGGATRYRLLETMRQYARDRLCERGEDAHWQERLLAYLVVLVEEAEPELEGANQQASLDRLEAEHDNLRSSLTWSATMGGAAVEGLRLAGALSRFWVMRGYLDEGRGRLSSLLAAAHGEQAPAARAKALKGAGILAYYQCDYPAARTFYEQSLAIYRSLGDRHGVDVVLHNLGAVVHSQGDYPAARALYEESLAISEALGDQRGIATSVLNLGNVAYGQGDYVAAQAFYEQSLVIYRELGDMLRIAVSLRSLAEVACAKGEFPAAQALGEESLTIERELGNRQGIAYSLNDLGLIATEQGLHAAARALHDESLAISLELGDRWGIAWSLEGLAYVAVGFGQPDRAARMWGAMERLREEIGAPITLSERPRYERRVTSARSAIGDAAFELARQEGRSMTLEQVIQYARLPD
jgi:predicted ATPase/class 3 adenylate cyclase